MKAKIYIETTIPSYLAAWPSRDLVTAAHQQITHHWWKKRRQDFNIYISQNVLDEAASGDPDAAKRRREILENLPLLDINDEVSEFAQTLIELAALPQKAAADALHIAVAVVNGMDYLLTWNCTHIANAALRTKIESACRRKGYEPIIICTPEELLEVE
jgi:predicted nucleic acid-binding protein